MAANAAAPSGFQPLRRLDGAAPNYGIREDFILPTYATRINFGDPVFRASDGTIRLYVAGGTTVHGIFRGCKFLNPVTNAMQFSLFWPGVAITAGLQVTCQVDNDPNMTFMAQVAGTALTQTSIGLNMDITAATSGTSTSLIGMSTCSLSGTAAATATLPFRIVSIIGNAQGLLTPAINAAYVGNNDNQWLEVSLNTSDQTTRTGQA